MAVTRLFDLPFHQLENYPQVGMFVTKVEGHWQKLSTNTFVQLAEANARGLVGMGVQPGDKIGLISTNRYEWNVLDIAIQMAGAIGVPLYPNISEKDYTYILNDANLKHVVVGTQELMDKMNSIKDSTPSVLSCFSMDETTGDHWSKIAEYGNPELQAEVDKRKAAITSEQLATIIYTSGTTGNPKGVMLSHNNLLSNSMACVEAIPADNNSRVLSFLPVCHVYERMLHYLYMYLGCSIHFAVSMDTIGENIKEVQPQVFTAVPRLIEKVFDKIMAKGDELSGIKRKLFFWAVELAEEYEMTGKSLWYGLKLGIARRLIFSKWQEALGGNVKAIASGSAALQPRLARIFMAAGIPVLEGYGLSETSPVVSVNSFQKGIVFGSVGALIDDVEVKIAEDGEILVKGPNVMLGYYNLPEETAKAFDAEGWFKTGDIGEMIQGKYLKITDRKKEIFKTSGGKYIIPQAMENKFKESRFIEQIIVMGESRKYPCALIVPNFAFVKEWAFRKKIDIGSSNEEIIANQKVNERIQKEVTIFNEGFGQWEKIKKICLLPAEFSIDGGELTPTLKLKRKQIKTKYQAQYDSLYDPSEL
ncbi:MAG: long-chain fatty acid--CoA ligase [Bacteroidetes bacterium]|nr:long-chain fatty acid--CoA ligase [Bacteroidota bacterium]